MPRPGQRCCAPSASTVPRRNAAARKPPSRCSARSAAPELLLRLPATAEQQRNRRRMLSSWPTAAAHVAASTTAAAAAGSGSSPSAAVASRPKRAAAVRCAIGDRAPSAAGRGRVARPRGQRRRRAAPGAAVLGAGAAVLSGSAAWAAAPAASPRPGCPSRRSRSRISAPRKAGELSCHSVQPCPRVSRVSASLDWACRPHVCLDSGLLPCVPSFALFVICIRSPTSKVRSLSPRTCTTQWGAALPGGCFSTAESSPDDGRTLHNRCS
jgi:hypothetical protein